MRKFKIIDYITSLTAAILWLLGGILAFLLIGFTAKHAIAEYGHSPKGAPIYTVVGLLLYVAFVLGAWLSVKYIFPLFLRATKQSNFEEAVHKYIQFSWLSIFSLLLADVIAKNNVVINFSIWTLALAGIYLAATYKTAK